MSGTLCALVLTYNEAPNIRRTLAALHWVPRIVVLDSHSTDETPKLAAEYANVEVHQRAFDTHTNQWNAGLALTGDVEWVLALDADYFISPALAEEILHAIQSDLADVYWLHFNYAINGNTIRSGIYPPVQSLFKKKGANYVEDGHTQRLLHRGKSGRLKEKAIHDDRKSFERWITSQVRYAQLEVGKLLNPSKKLGLKDKLRVHTGVTPFLVFIYCIFVRLGWMDGVAGWQYAWQRCIAESILRHELLSARKERKT